MPNNKGKRLYSIVALIGLLMLLNTLLIYLNGQKIEENKRLIENAEQVKRSAEDIIQTLHLLDLGIRAYALLGDNEMFINPRDSASIRKNADLEFLEYQLRRQNFDMKQFEDLRISTNQYFLFIDSVAHLLDNGENENAKALIAEDRGYPVWLKATKFSKHVSSFENKVEAMAQEKFDAAIKNSYWLQILLFLIAMPTLIYAVIHSVKSLNLAEKLKQVEKEKSAILEDQNITLEKLVRERTDEILAQNEEISAQNEEISAQNEELFNTKMKVEAQQKLLLLRVDELASEITNQNKELKLSNAELITQKNKLEQFAYIISHNLRAPIARLTGLGHLIESSDDEGEKDGIMKLMLKSTEELNEVIQDLGNVLLIQNTGSKTLEPVNLPKLIEKVRKSLSSEIRASGATINTIFNDLEVINALPLYLESIFYNLISNAIKYKRPDSNPKIELRTKTTVDDYIIEVEDNGLGIDLKRDRHKLFGLYNRFYFHVTGKGLGLFLVKKQVETMGGRIEVKSKLGKGSTFIIKFRKTDLIG